MAQAEDMLTQTAAELRRHIRIVRILMQALPRLLRRRRRVESLRNARQQDPVLDGNLNRSDPDLAAQWGALEAQRTQLTETNAQMQAQIDAMRVDNDALRAQLGSQQAATAEAGRTLSREEELQSLTNDVRSRVAQDPVLAAQVAGLSPAEQDLVYSAVAGNIQTELHGDELVRRPDGSLMTRNEELQSLTDDVRAQVAQNPELSAQLAGLSPAEQDLAQRQAALGIQQEMDRRFPDSRDPNQLGTQAELDRQAENNLDQDHDQQPDDLENRHEAEEAAQRRQQQDQEYQQYVDPDGDGVDNAVQDRERERAEQDQQAEARRQQERDQGLEEQQSTERDAETAATAAGTATAVDELDDELNEPDAEQTQQTDPEAERAEPGADRGQQEELDGPEGDRGQAELDGPEGEQVQGQQGPGAEPGIDQQGQDQQSAGQPGVQVVGQDGQEVPREADGSIRNQAFTVGRQNQQEPQQDQQGEAQPGQDQPGQGQQSGQNRQGPGVDQAGAQADGQGQRPPDPLDAQLNEARQANGRGSVQISGGVSDSTINGVHIQSAPGGEFSAREDGGVSYRGTNPAGQEVRMEFGPGSTVGGKPMDADELNRLQAQQTSSPRAGSPRPEANAAETEGAGQGARPDHALRAARTERSGRDAESGGREPKGR